MPIRTTGQLDCGGGPSRSATYWRSPHLPTTAPGAGCRPPGRSVTRNWARNWWRCGKRTTRSMAGANLPRPPAGQASTQARDQVARLMRNRGLRGATRAKRWRTTKPDPVAARAPDLVNRRFTASGPDQHDRAIHDRTAPQSGRAEGQRRPLARARRPGNRSLLLGRLVQHRTAALRTQGPDPRRNRRPLPSGSSAHRGLREPTRRASIRPRPVQLAGVAQGDGAVGVEAVGAEPVVGVGAVVAGGGFGRAV